jgi:hypothetical protein
MESRPVLFNDKSNLKDIKDQDPIEVTRLGDDPRVRGETSEMTSEREIIGTRLPNENTENPDEEADEGESQNHTVSTIVESDRIRFDNGIDDESDGIPEPNSSLPQGVYQKDDITQFSKNRGINLMFKQ